MPIDTTDVEARKRKKAHELVSKLQPASCVTQVHVDRVTVHGADVLLEVNQRSIPMDMLETIGEYGDLRIEGARGSTVEAIVQL